MLELRHSGIAGIKGNNGRIFVINMSQMQRNNNCRVVLHKYHRLLVIFINYTGERQAVDMLRPSLHLSNIQM